MITRLGHRHSTPDLGPPETLLLSEHFKALNTPHLGSCLEVRGQAKGGPVCAGCRVPRLLPLRLLPFVSHLSFDDLLCRLISYIREFNEQWWHLFRAHTCARACVNRSVNTLLSSLERQIFHSWLVCRIMPDYIRLA